MIDLHLPERKKAGNVQERVSQICHEQIIPALSRLCDELSPEQGRMIVDKLELDVGVINDQNMERELPERLLSQFKEEVKKLKLALLFGLDPSLQQSASHTDPDEESRSRVDLLIHFVRHGTVPWWNPYPNRDLSQWVREQFEEDEQSLIAAVGAELGTSTVRKRVVRLLSDRQFQSLFQYFELQDVFLLYLALKDEVHQQNSSQRKTITWRKLRNPFLETLLEQLWTYSLRAATGTGHRESSTQGVTSQQKKIAVANAIHSLEESLDLPGGIVKEAIRRLNEDQALFSQEEWERVYNDTDTHPDIDEQKLPIVSAEETSSDPSPKAGREPFIEIQNAGLVLLWTNLSRLFTTLGYVKEQAFVDEQAIHRAVHLLHFVSTGQSFGEEHKWSLNKLLCGLQPGSFVPYEIDLADREKEEAEAMTKAAIKNWRALKSTSVDGFRDAFLQRDGILTSDLNGWKLQVERLSYDILLDKLPWPISVIKLPWNDHLIHVQW